MGGDFEWRRREKEKKWKEMVQYICYHSCHLLLLYAMSYLLSEEEKKANGGEHLDHPLFPINTRDRN